MSRFLNADALASTGQGLLGNNMFAYCGNNPIIHTDPNGKEYRLVGGGLQFEMDLGAGTVGIEIIIYWDVDECADGGFQIAVYVYGGISLPVNDPGIAAILTTITENTDLLVEGSEAEMIAMATLLGAEFSISVSAVAIFGDETFISTESYEGSFSSFSVSGGRVKGGVAYAKNCKAVALGAIAVGSQLIPSISISKTLYAQIFEFNTLDLLSGNSTGASYQGSYR